MANLWYGLLPVKSRLVHLHCVLDSSRTRLGESRLVRLHCVLDSSRTRIGEFEKWKGVVGASVMQSL